MKIDDEVLKVLSAAEISTDGVQIRGDLLERKLYERTNKVLNAAGAFWNKKRRTHVFADGHTADKIEQALLNGQITTHQETDFFPTPVKVVSLMLEAAEFDKAKTHEVLEPSAGRGAIAEYLVGARRLVCLEKDPQNVAELRRKIGIRGVLDACDFLETTPADIGAFDRVIMNPPFSKQQDIAHIRHAYSFLKPGGRIVSIASPGLMFRQDRKAAEFREWLDGVNHDIHRLPEGSFKSSGTMVSTIMLTIDRG